MGVAQKVRRTLVEDPRSLGAGFRSRRWALVQELFPDLSSMDVVDLGGTVEAWERAPVRPARVTVLNLTEPGISRSDDIVPVLGDACDAGAALAAATGRTRFDLVFSNSVLEHLGGHANRARFAETVHALAPLHWVQTPYRYFPIEPHWLFPGMQFLPITARARVAERWPLSHSRSPDRERATSSALWTELISVTELRHYFPGSEVVHERFLGLTKSIIAVRR
ncbi:methyltransferase type 11 [Nocardioides glacieisoli]|uniref:Methyltransferase type 11 n=1 Tax=Nocardioides glacieisoli TaxID=1168730 RepID=A0A4Q2RQ12_9ACTN|nr:methyltransferase type 11 [Nocardioides glacieisoli]RYB90728.1 methyltransferase type 11 [Nocardioides glacieisoli]